MEKLLLDYDVQGSIYVLDFDVNADNNQDHLKVYHHNLTDDNDELRKVVQDHNVSKVYSKIGNIFFHMVANHNFLFATNVFDLHQMVVEDYLDAMENNAYVASIHHIISNF